MNYFVEAETAERYARGRPYIHPLVVERIKAACLPSARLDRALDVGCGTGQSSLALADLAPSVIGLDVSLPMLRYAPVRPGLHFVQALAEALPFAADAFDLVTAGLAFHWFDRFAFLREARRVLRPLGWLVIYNDGHPGQMIGNEDYARWSSQYYAVRYPAPPRASAALADDEAARHGLARTGRERFSHVVEFTPERLVGYLLTQSNVIAVATAGGESFESIGDRLKAAVRSFFEAEVAQFPFHCSIDIFQRQT